MYKIRWQEDAIEDMKRMRLRAYDVAEIVDAVDEQLTHEAERITKNKKILRPGQRLPFEHLEPVWQLRVRDFRVFYDVTPPEAEDEREGEGVVHEAIVSVRAVRHKPGHKTTKEIL